MPTVTFVAAEPWASAHNPAGAIVVHPVAQQDVAITEYPNPVVIPVAANDIKKTYNLDPASITVMDAASHGTTGFNVPVDGSVTYTPTDAAFSGLDTFTYVIEDVNGNLSNVANVQVTVTQPPLVDTFPNNFKTRVEFRIPANSFSSAMVNFPLLINTQVFPILQTATKLQTSGGQLRHVNGFDVKFELANGTNLDYDREEWNGTTGNGIYWVRLPNVNTAVLTFYMYLGNTAITTDPSNSSNVWQDYIGVWSGFTGVDRTGNNNGLAMTDVVASPIFNGNAGVYNGTTSQGLFANPTWFGGWAALSVQASYRMDNDAIGQNRGVVIQGTPNTSGASQGVAFYMREASSGQITNPLFSNFSTNGAAGSNAAFFVSDANRHDNINNWVTSTWQAGAAVKMYKNADELTQTNTATATGLILKKAGDFYIGRSTGTMAMPEQKFKGLIRQVRLKPAVITADQHKSESLSQLTPGMFQGASPLQIPTMDVTFIMLPLSATVDPGNTPIDLDVVAAAYNPTPDTITLSNAGAPAAGSVSIVGNKIRYVPNGGSGVFNWRYTVTSTIGANNVTAHGFVSVRVNEGPAIEAELPVAKRELWGNAGFTTGLTDAQLNVALLADAPPAGQVGFVVGGVRQVFIKQGSGGTTNDALEPGDHVMLGVGPFTNNHRFGESGTQTDPIVYRNAKTLNIGQTVVQDCFWFTEADDVRFYGLTFNSVTAKVSFAFGQQAQLPGRVGNFVRNYMYRCDASGWGQPGFLVIWRNNDARVWYSTFHDPLDPAIPAEAARAGYPAPQIPPAGDAIAQCIRGRAGTKIAAKADPTNTFSYGIHIKKCLFFNFPPKPVDAGGGKNYKTFQDDVFEYPEDATATAAYAQPIRTVPTADTHGNGTLTGFTRAVNAGGIFELNYVKDHLQADAGTVDLKCGGNIIRKCTFDNMKGRVDARANSSNIFEDLNFINSGGGMWHSGWGHETRRCAGGKYTFTAGQRADAGGYHIGDQAWHQQSQDNVVEDITGDIIVAQGSSGYVDATNPVIYQGFPAKNITITRANPAPNVADGAGGAAGGVLPNRFNCTYTGPNTPTLPQGCPAIGDVGSTTPWVG